jgi:competence protein ComEA
MERLLGALAADDDPGDDGPGPGRHRPGGVPLLSVPSSLRTAQLRVTPAAVWGLVLVVVAVAAVLGVRVAWAERSAQPTPVSVAPAPTDPGQSRPRPADPAVMAETEPVESGVSGSEEANPGVGESYEAAAGAPSGPGPGHAGSPTAPAPVVVHVIGAVRRPGVVPVPPGSRVHEAVHGAGGLSDDADLTRINLARVVGDGERIWVPVRGEEPPDDVALAPVDGSSGPAGAGGSTSPGPGVGGAGGAGTPLVDVNTADQTLLETLPGVGPVTAQRILQWRSDNGRFSAPEELLEVSGIGPRTLEQLRPHITVGG